MESTKCPVCGKTDIPDYLNEDVKCPCCGCDLSIYRVVEKIPEGRHNPTIWKPISAVACIVAVVLGIILCTQGGDTTTTQPEILSQLEDSIVVLNNRLAQREPVVCQSDFGFKYAVVHGDSYWSISKKFYGTGTRCKDIAEQNDRTVDTPLNIGDTLIIKQVGWD